MTLTQTGTRAAAVAATSDEFPQSDHESVANGKEVKEDYETLDSEKREINIAEWIGWPRKPPSSNEDKEAEAKEEDAGATPASTEDKFHINEDNKVFEDDREDDHKYTVLSDDENTKEEALSGHKSELLSLDSSERSDDNDEDYDGTGAKDNNCDNGGDRNTDARWGYAECLRFLGSIAITEPSGAMAKAKSSLATKPRKNRSWEKVIIK